MLDGMTLNGGRLGGQTLATASEAVPTRKKLKKDFDSRRDSYKVVANLTEV